MSRINTIKKALQIAGIGKYQITEVTEHNYEQYYVKHQLETIRTISDTIDHVVIYVENKVKDKVLLGQADFKVAHPMSKREIVKLIEEAKYQATFVHNQNFELVKNPKKQSYKYKELELTKEEILQKIATIFFNETNDKLRYNSLELFFKDTTVEFVNSNGTNLKKRTFKIEVEAIPSYYSQDFKTELYRMFKYNDVNFEKVQKDAKQALLDVDLRGNAQKIGNIGKCNVILRSEHIYELFDELISTYTYGSVYNHSNLNSVGDDVQANPYEKINLSLDKATKADFFDGDGVILNKAEIIKDGKLVSYYGNNRFAQYLNLKPTGNLPKIILKNGKKSIEVLKKQPYIEIIDLSGIQADVFANYIGGEVRLAKYFDGKNTYPISGFSFSTNIMNAINNTYFSKEKESINNYEGPAFIRMENVDIL